MKRKWAGWLSTYSFLLHFRFSPLPQFSVYFSCENPVGSKDVLGITRKWVKSKRTFGIKMAQELLWDIWGSIKLEPNVYFWKCLEQWKKKSNLINILNIFFVISDFPPCHSGQFRCENHRCIPVRWHCDGYKAQWSKINNLVRKLIYF